jgi:hypothetical protein
MRQGVWLLRSIPALAIRIDHYARRGVKSSLRCSSGEFFNYGWRTRLQDPTRILQFLYVIGFFRGP